MAGDHTTIARWAGVARCFAGVAAAVLATTCGADVVRGDPASYLGLLKSLRPGDTLELEPGRYERGLPVHGLAGMPGRPIVIKGPAKEPYARFVARRGAHTVSIVNAAWVEIRNLELDGDGQPVSGVRCEGHAAFAHHITLDHLSIRGHGAGQGVTGIATFCPAWNWTISNNTIIGAGTGMYLGQSDGTAPFFAGLIERNVIVDTLGYNVQIKHQQPRSRVEGMPEGTSMTVIRHNVFAKSETSSAGHQARPNLLVGHWPLTGPGADDSYAIYGNLFYENPTEALFQGEGNFAFYANVLVNTHGDAIHVQPHNDVPRRIDIFRNTVLAAHNGIRVNGGHAEHAQRVTANAVFAAVPIAGGEQAGNWTGALTEAGEHLKSPFGAPAQLDLSPRAGKLMTVPPQLLPAERYGDVDRDFDGTLYRRPVAGAYAGDRDARPLRLPRPR